MTSRRSFMSLMAGAAASLAIDPDLAVWKPGARIFSFASPKIFTVDDISRIADGMLWDWFPAYTQKAPPSNEEIILPPKEWGFMHPSVQYTRDEKEKYWTSKRIENPEILPSWAEGILRPSFEWPMDVQSQFNEEGDVTFQAMEWCTNHDSRSRA